MPSHYVPADHERGREEPADDGEQRDDLDHGPQVHGTGGSSSVSGGAGLSTDAVPGSPIPDDTIDVNTDRPVVNATATPTSCQSSEVTSTTLVPIKPSKVCAAVLIARSSVSSQNVPVNSGRVTAPT